MATNYRPERSLKNDFKPSGFEKSLEKTYNERVQQVQDAPTHEGEKFRAWLMSGVVDGLLVPKTSDEVDEYITTFKDQCVREERERILHDIETDPEIPIPRPYEVAWIMTKIQHADIAPKHDVQL